MKELNIEEYINTFTQFYGEEYRRAITKKLYNVEFVFLDDLFPTTDFSSININIYESEFNFDTLKTSYTNEEIIEKVTEKVESLNIKGDKSHYIDSMVGLKNCTKNAAAYITPFVKDNEELSPSILCVLKSREEIESHNFYHELTHVIQSSFHNITKDGFEFHTGFNYQHQQFNEQENEEQVPQEQIDSIIFNEVIIDYLTMQTMQSKISEVGTTYSHGFIFLKDFIEAYKPELIKCLMSDNAFEFQNIIGKENFKNLAKYTTEMVSYANSEAKLVWSISQTLGIPIKSFSTFKQHFSEIDKLDLPEKERGYVDCHKNLTITTKNILKQKENENYLGK